MKNVSPYYWLAFLLTASFTMATLFVPSAEWWNNAPDEKLWQQNGSSASDNAFQMLLGDGRKMFANQFFVMADVYFHSGYYPSIFDEHEKDLDVAAGAEGKAGDSDSTSDDFLGPPQDWIDALGRNFEPNKHTHLDAGGATGNVKATAVEEILPWLKLSAEMDPQKIETYTVGAYFLSTVLKQPNRAEEFLREGLRNNPENCELLFAMGRLDYEDYHNTNLARNVWELAFKKWEALDVKTNEEAKLTCDEITVNLGDLERAAGNYPQAIHWLEDAQKVSPAPEALQRQIDEIKVEMSAQPAAPTNSIP